MCAAHTIIVSYLFEKKRNKTDKIEWGRARDIGKKRERFLVKLIKLLKRKRDFAVKMLVL